MPAQAQDGTARISKDGLYRYILTRYLSPSTKNSDPDDPKTVTFVMLNPSTADGKRADPTLRRCMQFAEDWGYATLRLLNLYAYRATDPKVLKTTPDPIGPENDALLTVEPAITDRIIVAWGQNAPYARAEAVLSMLKNHASQPELYCLGITASGYPRHPLYVAAHTRPFPYRPAYQQLS